MGGIRIPTKRLERVSKVFQLLPRGFQKIARLQKKNHRRFLLLWYQKISLLSDPRNGEESKKKFISMEKFSWTRW